MKFWKKESFSNIFTKQEWFLKLEKKIKRTFLNLRKKDIEILKGKENLEIFFNISLEKDEEKWKMSIFLNSREKIIEILKKTRIFRIFLQNESDFRKE